MSGRLIICATPIGNLDDAPPRLSRVLASADVVFAEDTRRTGKLLARLGVEVPQRSYFVGNEERRSVELASRLDAGETVALVSDAGVPSIADPGLSAVRVARRVGAAVSVVPGPSAVTTALAVSGLPADRFVFEGFLPRKGGARASRLVALAEEPRTVVLFSATQRLAADLRDLVATLGRDRSVTIGRELTKLHEELWWTTLGDAADRFAAQAARGEFTLVVAGAPEAEPDFARALDDVQAAVAAGVRLSEAVRNAAAEHGVRRRRLYALALELEEPSAP